MSALCHDSGLNCGSGDCVAQHRDFCHRLSDQLLWTVLFPPFFFCQLADSGQDLLMDCDCFSNARAVGTSSQNLRRIYKKVAMCQIAVSMSFAGCTSLRDFPFDKSFNLFMHNYTWTEHTKTRWGFHQTFLPRLQACLK